MQFLSGVSHLNSFIVSSMTETQVGQPSPSDCEGERRKSCLLTLLGACEL